MHTYLLGTLIMLWALVIYHHLGYPMLLMALSRRQQAQPQPTPPSDQCPLPDIVMVVPAYNEAAVIADKIRNTASLDYPASHFKLIIACDGCSDDTAAIAQATAQEPENRSLQIEIVEFEDNRGKVAVLNEIISHLECDCVALSDTSALLSIDGLQIAARHFCTPKVGVIAATYHLLTPGNAGEARYWQYQTRILSAEAQLGSPIGVHGALYFFRRPLFSALAEDTINDDFVLPMSIVAAGHQAVYEPEIIALELEQATDNMDQRRRIRISAGNLQQLLRLPTLLNPRFGGIAFAFFSGKALRAVMPLCLLLQLLLCCWLAHTSSLLLAISTLQIITLLAAVIVPHLTPTHMRLPTPITTLFYVVNGYRCGLIGSLRYLAGLERGRWTSVSAQESSS